MVHGAHDRIRTGDLVLTKDTLCHLSYVGALQEMPYCNRIIEVVYTHFKRRAGSGTLVRFCDRRRRREDGIVDWVGWMVVVLLIWFLFFRKP